LFAPRRRSHSFARTGFAAGLVVLATLLAVAAHAAPRPHGWDGRGEATPQRATAASARHAKRATAVQAANGLERELLHALNELRASSGLRPLRLCRGLAAAAAYHSGSMAREGYFSHSSADGSRFWERVGRFYRRPSGWSVYIVGENLIRGATSMSAEDVLQGWLSSPPHRRNLLGDWTEVGFGAVRAVGAPGVYDGHNVAIVTADFGKRG
jgi:uncharacterized protein YkwD